MNKPLTPSLMRDFGDKNKEKFNSSLKAVNNQAKVKTSREHQRLTSKAKTRCEGTLDLKS